MRRIIVTIQRDDDYCKAAELNFEDDRLCISVSKSTDLRTMKAGPAEVNWAGCGAKSPEYAADYARVILYAVSVAADWDATGLRTKAEIESYCPDHPEDQRNGHQFDQGDICRWCGRNRKEK